MLVRETGLAHRRRKHKQADNQDEKDGEAQGRDTRETATSAGGGVIAAAAAVVPPLPPPSHGHSSIHTWPDPCALSSGGREVCERRHAAGQLGAP